uniref:Reverse transcriptase zinc-binding domain-containing protein n=1 Tax=Kalanchoe fedtschenkoi TaxID=63787 RepID=A0A7N0ZRT4_KALFE
LNTKQRLLKFGISVDPIGVLCEKEVETLEHLFFCCPISKLILHRLMMKVGIQNSSDSLDEILNFVSCHLTEKEAWKMAGKAAISLAIYILWKERNIRIFKGKKSNVESITREGALMLSKIKNLKLTARNVTWAEQTGINPSFWRKTGQQTTRYSLNQLTTGGGMRSTKSVP